MYIAKILTTEEYHKFEPLYEDFRQKAAKEYNLGTNYVAGANIAAFDKVSKAMLAQGLI